MAAMAPAPLLLLTGVPGVGKTTVVHRALDGLTGWRLAGFWTEEIRAAGKRVGFRLEGLHGAQAVLAHVDVRSRHRVSRYGVDVDALDRMVASALALDPAVDAYVVDEIGKMECCSPRFVRAMRSLLASGQPVVATVALRGGGFMAEVKQRPDALLWEITRSNRDELPGQVIAWLEAARAGG